MTENKEQKVEEVLEETSVQNDTPMEEKVEETKAEEEKKEKVVEEVKEEKTETAEEKKDSEKSEKKDDKKNTPKKGAKKSKFKRREREKPEFESKIISLRRVTRVMAGGRRFSFSVALVIGDKKNRVGFGTGKSNDVVSAIAKAERKAKKNLVKIKLTDKDSIPYDVYAKYKASEVVIRPVFGKGLAAGGAVRVVLEFAGVKQAGAKILSRSKNHINNVRATLKALEPFTEKFEYKEKPRFSDRKKFGKKFDKKKNSNKKNTAGKKSQNENKAKKIN